jgi:outer membrane lipoprotein SlyB
MTFRDHGRAALLHSAPATSAGHGVAGLHPLIKGAAIAVIALCAVGVGVMTGLIPSPLTRASAPDASIPGAVADNSVPADANAPAGYSATGQPLPPVAQAPSPLASSGADYASGSGDDPMRVSRGFGSTPTTQLVAPPCTSCGVVQSLRSYKVAGQGTGVGAVGGGVVGGVVGNQFGGGGGRVALTVLGALGGAFAGNQIEKHVRSSIRYEMKVRMDNGTIRTFHSSTPYSWQNGDPVRIVNGNVTSRAVDSTDTRSVRVSDRGY